METTKIDIELLKTIPLPDYSEDAAKDDYGKLLLIAGSRRLPGAAILAAKAALRTGCGTVRAALPDSIAIAVGAALPELMVLPLPETPQGTLSLEALAQLQEQYEACDAVVIGPGLDSSEATDQLCRKIAEDCPLPLLMDAQALTAFDKDADYPAARVLTPHLREMSELSGASEKAIVKDRASAASDFVQQKNVTIVLKGRETLVAAVKVLYQNEAGTRGLGTAGSGDVLSGIIGSFLAQGVVPSTAAAWGVHIHALAGEAAEKDLGDDGIIASDIIAHTPGVLRYLRRQLETTKKEGKRAGLRAGLRG